MADPITLKGIQRNASKLAVEDGRAEDLINLRFKDGSWRTAGNGKQVWSFEHTEGGETYSQIFIHVNAYHHVIGYRDGGIYWFANIDNDGVFEEIEPRLLCGDVSDSNIIYNQTGHLFIVIKQRERITFFFNRATGEYEVQEKMVGDNTYSHPLGNVRFKVANRKEDDIHTMVYCPTLATIFGDQTQAMANITYVQNGYNKIIKAMKQENSFHGSFLVCVAVELYNGKWGWATSPVMINPSYCGDVLEKIEGVHGSERWDYSGGYYTHEFDRNIEKPMYAVLKCMMQDGKTRPLEGISGGGVYKSKYLLNGYSHQTLENSTTEEVNVLDRDGHYSFDDPTYHELTNTARYADIPVIGDCFYRPHAYMGATLVFAPNLKEHLVWGKLNDLYINIDSLNIQQNAIYKSIGVFVTPVFDDGAPLKLDADSLRYAMFNNNAGFFPIPMTDIRRTDTTHNQYESGEVTYLSTGGDGRSALRDNNGYLGTWNPTRTFSANNLSDAKKSIEKSQFYLIKQIQIDDIKQHLGEWVKVELEPGTLEHLTEYVDGLLPTDAFTAMSFINAGYGFTYNGRLHLANYKKSSSSIWGMKNLKNNDESDGGYRMSIEQDFLYGISNISRIFATNDEDENKRRFLAEISEFNLEHKGWMATNHFANQTVTMDSLAVKPRADEQILYTYSGISEPNHIPIFIPYPNIDIEKIILYYNKRVSNDRANTTTESHATIEYLMENAMTYYGIRFYLVLPTSRIDYSQIEEPDFIDKSDIEAGVTLTEGDIDVPNGLLVSDVNVPTYFPAENAYLVGNTEIIAMGANAIAVGTGQTGEAPLYVFCKDGVYALFVDASGLMAYTNSRILAREVCNNIKSVVSIDTGVVFTTDRGLMCMAGEKVIELGQPAEGDVVEYTEPNWAKPNNVGKNMLTKVAELPLNLVDGVDFLSYLTGAIVNYNHNERELMISNPAYPYTYVLDRYNNWSRRDYTADEYVNNFPTSYRVKDGVFYKVDAEQDGLEGKSEAPNKFLYLSNVLKLGSVDFKQAYRFVVRGKFNTREYAGESFYTPTSSVILYDKTQEDNIIKHFANNKEYKISPKYDDANLYTYTLRIFDTEGHQISAQNTVNGVVTFIVEDWNNVGTISLVKQEVAYPTHEHLIEITDAHILGCYVFGSYDGNQFALLGANEKKGQFTDIGCKIERTDVKYFRIGLAGHLSGDSRIDFMEIEGAQSNLTTKLR